VARAGASLYARACLAENQGLRGRVDEARAGFEALLAEPNPPATQAWLRTSLAELEQRAGHADAAERQFRSALALDADPYTRMAYADLLIDTRRPAQALGLLKGEVRSDAVLLRLAIAGKQAQSPGAQADALEMRERIALANERPDAKIFHGREQALFALAIEGDARRALALAQGNVTQQREPLDLLVLARAARASGDAAAIAEAGAIARQMGLVDQRLKETL
jgi:hypothetical protein